MGCLWLSPRPTWAFVINTRCFGATRTCTSPAPALYRTRGAGICCDKRLRGRVSSCCACGRRNMAQASAVSFVQPSKVKAMLRGRVQDKMVVMDVRDSDFCGGHIKGAVNIVAARFDDDNVVDQLIEEYCQDTEVVVLHCYLSQQRGPYCAQRLAERLEAQGRVLPEVCVMAGGWKRFRRELELEDFELVEGFED